MIKIEFQYLIWSICATIWAMVCFILPDYIDNPISDISTFITIIVYLVALGVASFWVLYLAGLNRCVTYCFLPIFGIGGAIVSYYRVAFHATITPMIIDATLHTNTGTIAGVVSWQLIGWIGLNILIVIGLIWWRKKLYDLPNRWVHALVVLGLLLIYYNANGRLHISINQRYPYNVVHCFIEYCLQQQELHDERIALAYEETNIPDSIDIIFVLGEAARADHIQLNGYSRETTPLLSKRKNVVSLPHIYSEHTYTSTSVPLILSPSDSLHPEFCGTHSSFIRIFSQCGFSTAWISNQDNGRTYLSFIHECDTIIFPNPSKSVFVFDPWYDEQLLPPLDSLLLRSSSRNMFVLHTIGSHWYYNLHVPPTQQYFNPTTENRIITENSAEQIVNSYDNTIRYVDIILDSIIQRMENRCALVIYLSDHGESLGENGCYLHAAETESLHLPACIIWYSEAYAKLFPAKIQALQRNKDKRYRTDFLYHSILSSAGIKSEGSESLDVFTLYSTYVNQ